MLKVGHRGYLQLAEGFDSPRWREGLVIGLQKEWVQDNCEMFGRGGGAVQTDQSRGGLEDFRPGRSRVASVEIRCGRGFSKAGGEHSVLAGKRESSVRFGTRIWHMQPPQNLAFTRAHQRRRRLQAALQVPRSPRST